MLPRMDAALATLSLKTLQTDRAEALDALHRLRTGAKTQSLSHQGSACTFAETGDLERYIGQLQAAIDGKTSSVPTARRPFYPGMGM